MNRHKNINTILITLIFSIIVSDCTTTSNLTVEEQAFDTEELMAAASRRGDRVRRREFNSPDPIVRIGLMEEYDRIDFIVNGNFDLVNLDGIPIEENILSEKKWHVVPETTEEAHAIYSILVTASGKRDAADKVRRSLGDSKHPARVVEVGSEVSIDGRVVTNNIKYRVLAGRWPTEREARKHMVDFSEEYAPRVVRQIIKPAGGTLDFLNEDYTSRHKIEDGFRIIPKDGCNVTMKDVREGTGFHWEREVDRNYPGIIEIRVDHRGLLMALTEVSLEEYLKGVVPAEMPASYPIEALKAQAIAARSETLAKIGVKHLNDPFDLCAHVHCQAYSGCTHQHDRTSQAVIETRGQVLMLDNRVAESVYSSCCGGHSEDKINVWNPPAVPHLTAHWDCAPDKKPDTLDLTAEADVEKWVLMQPDVWCNTTANGPLPNILLNAQQYFRWETVVTKRDLEDIIHRKSGEDIGELIDIVPLKRGASGRLMEIEIQGTKQNLRIQRELNIRNVLSDKYMKSACFSIHIETNEDGTPVQFRFKGAGWGHGVGMCQVGAGVMAVKNHTCKEILSHYYAKTNIVKVYEE